MIGIAARLKTEIRATHTQTHNRHTHALARTHKCIDMHIEQE